MDIAQTSAILLTPTLNNLPTMKKKLLIIHPNDYSIGVELDAERYKSFFMSHWGGCWEEEEIEICKEQNRFSILLTTHDDRLAKYDYYICIFTGHGGIENNKLMLEPCIYDEALNAESLLNIAERQLTIFDCCRTYSENETDSIKAAHIQESFCSIDRKKIREAYERRIAITPPKQYVLFACSPGQAAHGSSINGGLFTHHLLNKIKERIIAKRYYTVGEAFNYAREQCVLKGQLPEAIIPKELSNRQLIFGINPYATF